MRSVVLSLSFIAGIIVLFWLIFALFAPSPAMAEPAKKCQNFERIQPFSERILEILREEGVPEELICLAIAESGGKTDAVSKKGAAGLWQLMPATARRYGLVVSHKRDERMDVEKSTRAAARYLRHLLDDFDGDISWAVAAYNAGGHNIRSYYQRGARIGVLKRDYPEAYLLAVSVGRLINEMQMQRM